MTVIQQIPQHIDSNVVINPPEKIEINYEVNKGWHVVIDGEDLQQPIPGTGTMETIYWTEAGEPLQYLIDRHLVVTKAYNELQKACKKVSRKKKSEDK